MFKDLQGAASALYDGGWRSKDRIQLKYEHGLTDEEVDAICAELAKMEKN